MASWPHSLAPILPCTDLEASTDFYRRLRMEVFNDYGRYRIMGDGKGWFLHLSNEAPEGWLVPERNPNGLYICLEDVDSLAAEVPDLIIGNGPEHKPWGMYEFAMSDPDGTLIRIGRPSQLDR